MLVNTIDVLKEAQRNNYAVAAFNVFNLETVQAAIKNLSQPQENNSRVRHLLSEICLLISAK